MNILRDECEKHPSDDLLRQFQIIDTRTLHPGPRRASHPEQPGDPGMPAIVSSGSISEFSTRRILPISIRNTARHSLKRVRFLIGITRNGSGSCFPGAISCSRKREQVPHQALKDLVVRHERISSRRVGPPTLKKPHSRIILSLATALPKVKGPKFLPTHNGSSNITSDSFSNDIPEGPMISPPDSPTGSSKWATRWCAISSRKWDCCSM